MRRLLNTLFVLSEDTFLRLDGENIVVQNEEKISARFPLHTLEGILYFGYRGASPALMGACSEQNISLSFLTPYGKYLCSVSGKSRGNVLLRKKQFQSSEDLKESHQLAKRFLLGKLFNARWSLDRTIRDHSLRVDSARIQDVCNQLVESIKAIESSTSLEELRGFEGDAANKYFGVFDELLLQNKDHFYFRGRNRRPPLDNVNAMLSFVYTFLANDCVAALESVGLDAYVGFLHRDRPGRASLALDLMEELRPILADRFVISCVNDRLIRPEHFETRENGAVLMTDQGRKSFLQAFQKKKKEIITHPFLDEKIPWGLVPYVQSLLLARYFREDLDSYPPFLWK